MTILITERDREDARQRALYTSEPFRRVLRQDLTRCLRGRPCCLVEDFVEYFNIENVRREKRKLETNGVKYPAYFEALTDVCVVDSDYQYLYPITPNPPFMTYPCSLRSRSTSVPPTSRLSWRERPSREEERPRSPESIARPLQRAASATRGKTVSFEDQAPPTRNDADTPRKLTIRDIQGLLVAFTHELAGKKIKLDDYLKRLDEHDPVLSEQFSHLKSSESERIKFLTETVTWVKNEITIDESNLLTISECLKPSCCGNRPPSPKAELSPSVGNAKKSFSESMKSFVKIKLPLNELLTVRYADCDTKPHRLRLNFIWENPVFDDLHQQLETEYRNNLMSVKDIYEGMICAAPWEGVKDYHRAVVKDVSDSKLPVVFYVDMGETRAIARDCIRVLHEKFYKVPTFYLSGEVRDSPSWPERNLLKEKLKKRGQVFLRALDFSEGKNRYILALDADSGVESDASRD